MPKEKYHGAVIGAGVMGTDIASIFASGGWHVHMVEPAEQSRATFPTRLAASLKTLKAKKGEASFSTYPALKDVPWKNIRLVVECVPENLYLKQRVFAELESFAPAEIPLTSNSSGLPISQIGQGLATQSRMIGLHFFMPAHLVPLVEVISSEMTRPSHADEVADIMRRLGKRPVHVCRDIPGFLANRIQHALMREAYDLIEKGIASPADVDAAVRYGFGFRYIAAGPLLQKDLSGLDSQYAAAVSIYPDLCNAREPSRFLREKVAAGDIGLKSGKGIYEWTEEKGTRQRALYESKLIRALAILMEGEEESGS